MSLGHRWRSGACASGTWGLRPGCMISPRSGLGRGRVDHRVPGACAAGTWGLRPRLYDFAPFGAWDGTCGSSGTWSLRRGHLGLAPRAPGARAQALRFRPVWGLGGDVWIVGVPGACAAGTWGLRLGHLGLAPRLYDFAPFGAWEGTCGSSGTWGLRSGTWGSRPRLYDFAPFGAWEGTCGSSGTWGLRLGQLGLAPRAPGARDPGCMISPRSGLGRGRVGRRAPGACALGTWGLRLGHLGLAPWAPGARASGTWGSRLGHLGLAPQAV